MTTIAQTEPRRVAGGIDTHKDVHVAAVIDVVGRSLTSESFPATRHGYRRLLCWLHSHGQLVAVGVEGTGSWGAGLARYLSARAVKVIEVNRPNRQNRRLRGKSDAVDAEAAARAVLNGQATVIPKSGTGPVEAVRQLRIARSGAMKARTAAANQLHSLCDTAPDAVRAQLAWLSLKRKVAIAERWRPGSASTVETAAKRALTTVARRWRALDDKPVTWTATSRSSSTTSLPHSLPPTGWATRRQASSWSPLATTPAASATRSPSPPSAAPRRCRPPPAGRTAIGSTEAVTAARTCRCGPSSSPGW